tara:strand:+ start:1368 stop:2138 length:771 start_codon:yes stop_codon:yes gene_type:complete
MYYAKKLKKINYINHCFFSRNGGYSKKNYRSLNCGRGSRDSKSNIKKNLSLIAKKMKINQKNLLLMHQTHSNKVIFVNNKNKNKKVLNCDAMITKLKGFALGVVTADCVPILLFDNNNKIIGCVHAGWKGAFKGVVENTIRKFRKVNSNNKIYAGVGPCIGRKSYEVDFKFYKNFVNKSKKNSIYFSKKNKNKKLFNLRKYVSDKLLKLNVNVDHVNLDTFKEKNKFFSYRRSRKLKEKDYGRCISAISLTKFSQN